MGLRVSIQAKLIALFKVNTFEVVQYDGNGVPSVGHGFETPKVVCNEVAASIEANTGQDTNYSLKDWSFDMILSFGKEVDFSNFIGSLADMTFSENNVVANVKIGHSVVIQHPVRQGAHSGSEIRFNINVNTRR